MTKIPAGVVADLINIGREGRPVIPESLSDPDTAHSALMVGDGPWKAVGRSMDSRELGGVIRGLVLFGVASGITGGSGSPVIALYRQFARRFPRYEEALASWIQVHRINKCEPFGGAVGNDVRNLAAYEKAGRESAAGAAGAEASRRWARAAKATQALPRAVRRGDLPAVIALLARGGDPHAPLPDGTSLIAHAEAHGCSKVADLLRTAEAASRGPDPLS